MKFVGSIVGTKVVVSDSGYLKEEQFLEFLRFFRENAEQGGVILILDRHKSHVVCIEALD